MGEDLTPAELRSDTITSWLRTLLRPMKYNCDLFFNDFCKGANYPAYNNATTYAANDRIIYTDNAVYERRVSGSGVHPTGDSTSAITWRKIQKCFIGVDERAHWNGQKIVFEYAINKWFQVNSAPFIFTNTIYYNANSTYYITLQVPTAVYTSLGSNNTARDNRLKQFAANYKPSQSYILINVY